MASLHKTTNVEYINDLNNIKLKCLSIMLPK